MKALTVKQPWAHFIMNGEKDVENRKQRTHFRGQIAIHVAKVASKPSGYISTIAPIIGPERTEAMVSLAHRNDFAGHVIGVAMLVDCVQEHPSPWSIEGTWQWVLENPLWFERTEEATGALGLWEWTSDEQIKGIHR